MEETMWKRLMKPNSSDILNKLCLYYGNFLPIEVRYHLSEWLENKITKLLCVDPDSSEYEMVTKQFQCELVAEILHRSNQMTTEDKIPTKTRFREAAERFKYMNSVDLFSQLSDIIRRECQLLYDFESGNYTSYVSQSKEMDGRIERLREEMSTFEANDLSKWKKSFFDYQEEYFLVNGNNSPLNAAAANSSFSSPSHPIEVNLHMSSLSCLLDILKSLQPQLSEKFSCITRDCSEIIDKVIEDYIKLWKHNQQKCGNNDFNINGADLEKLQAWSSELGKVLFTLRDIDAMLREHFTHISSDKGNFGGKFSASSQLIMNSLMKLITETATVEHQPPQVIKTNTRFAACVRLLIADALNNKITSGTLTAVIVSEVEARSFHSNASSELSCGEIANSQVNLEFNENNRQLVGSFRNMLLKNIKRVGKKSNEMVTDEKFALLFKVSMNLCGKPFSCCILSSPIVVIVHGSQEVSALATVFWDNAFAKIDRQLFYTPETIPWTQFAEALSLKFASCTGRGLTAENLHFLAEKLFDHRVEFPISEGEHFVTWNAFCKERLPNRDHTFWEWFYAALKVTKEHMKSAFYEGRVIGFIDKARTQRLLEGCPHGTFLLRFSDSELGGVSIAWVNSEKDEDGSIEPRVLHIQPINAKEFESIHLNQRLNDVEELTFLYPSIPKEEAFKIEEISSFNPSDYISFRTVMRVNINSSTHRHV